MLKNPSAAGATTAVVEKPGANFVQNSVGAGWKRLPLPVRGGIVAGVLVLLTFGEGLGRWRVAIALALVTAVGVPVGCAVARHRGLPALPPFLGFLRAQKPRREQTGAAAAVVKLWPELTSPPSPLARSLAGSTCEPWAKDTVSWSVRLTLARGRTADEVMNLSGPLESALDVRRGSLRVLPDERARRVTLRVIARDLLAEDQEWREPQARSVLQPIDLGRFEDAEPCQLHLMPAAGAGRNLAISGQPGSGKSGVLNLIVAALAGYRDCALAGIDPQGVELAAWEPVFEPGLLALDTESAEPVLRRVLAIMEARNRRLRQNRARVWTPTERGPALIVIVDEGSALASCMGLLEEIASRGRKLAVLLVFCTQRPSSAALGDRGKEMLSRCQSRIALRLADAVDVDIALGSGSAKEGWRADRVVTHRGALLLRDDDHFTVRVERGPYIRDRQVEAWAQKCAPNRPHVEEGER